MLIYSPEAAFILTLFELVLSGLPLAVLLWVGLAERVRSTVWSTLLIAFALHSGAVAVQALYDRIAVSPTGAIDASAAWLLFVSDGARLCSSVGFGWALIRRQERPSRVRTFLIVSAGTAGVAVLGLASGIAAHLVTIDPLTPIRIADVLVLATGSLMLGRVRSLPAAALLVLAAGRSSAIVAAAWPAETELLWGLGIALRLAGLIALALTLERESQLRLLHHVLRFNLVFVSLAASLVVVLAQIGQQQFLAFSVLQIRDVAELARGDLISRHRMGEAPETIVANASVHERLIREFGRYPDLRRVRLELEGHAMELAIDDAGEISEHRSTSPARVSVRVAPSDFAEGLLLREPVAIDGRRVGEVQLIHSLARINASIGRQMQAAFVVFTLFVVAGSLATGVLVLVAERTIGRQYRDLADAQRRLSVSERLASVGAVAGAVAHDINNPAGVLVARADYLSSVTRLKPYSADIQDDLDTIRRQAQRIAKTVRDLLQTADRVRSVHDVVDLSTIVESAIALIRPVFRHTPVSFEWKLAPDATRAWGDRDRLEQVLVNLLSNAAQAIQGSGRVTVTSARRPAVARIELAVTDTGAGIRPEDVGRIFEPFYTTKAPGVGTGLGLSIVRRIVRDHGGEITVESVLGGGTTFRISLPVMPEHAGAAGRTVTTATAKESTAFDG